MLEFIAYASIVLLPPIRESVGFFVCENTSCDIMQWLR